LGGAWGVGVKLWIWNRFAFTPPARLPRDVPEKSEGFPFGAPTRKLRAPIRSVPTNLNIVLSGNSGLSTGVSHGQEAIISKAHT
jgi:hypothetical protein